MNRTRRRIVLASVLSAPAAALAQPTPAAVVDVQRDFGAKGDGKTLDTAAIQAATASGASHIIFPAGTYLVEGFKSLGRWTKTSKLILEFQNCTIRYEPSMVWPLKQTWAMFAFNHCTDIQIRGTVTLKGNLTASNLLAASLELGIGYNGAAGFLFDTGAKRITIGTVIAEGIGMPVSFERRPDLTAAKVAHIGSGGSGYTVGDILTVIGGSPTPPTQVRVTQAGTDGAVSSAAIYTPGLYVAKVNATIPPVAPTEDGVSVTGGRGSGVKLNIQWADANEEKLTEHVTIDRIQADTCWYGFHIIYGGRHVRVKQLTCNNVYRAMMVYGGIDDMEADCTFRNHKGDSIAGGSAVGLGMKNVRLKVTCLPMDGRLGPTHASKIRLSYANSHPAIFENINLEVNADYGAGLFRGGSVFEVDKEDNKGRGRVFSGLTITGKITGAQDEDSGLGGATVIGTNVNREWSAADTFRDWKIGRLEIRNSKAAIKIDPRGFSVPAAVDAVYTSR